VARAFQNNAQSLNRVTHVSFVFGYSKHFHHGKISHSENHLIVKVLIRGRLPINYKCRPLTSCPKESGESLPSHSKFVQVVAL
jgi:hypothetical protein